jgi:hypothetical protein
MANESMHTNRRHSPAPNAGWRLRCAFHAQSFSPAAVGELNC